MKILSVMHSVVYAHHWVFCFAYLKIFFSLNICWEPCEKSSTEIKMEISKAIDFRLKRQKKKEIVHLLSYNRFIADVLIFLCFCFFTSTARNFNYFRNWAHLQIGHFKIVLYLLKRKKNGNGKFLVTNFCWLMSIRSFEHEICHYKKI